MNITFNQPKDKIMKTINKMLNKNISMKQIINNVRHSYTNYDEVCKMNVMTYEHIVIKTSLCFMDMFPEYSDTIESWYKSKVK